MQDDAWRQGLTNRLLELGSRTRPEDVIKAPTPAVGAFIRENPYAFCFAACLNRGMKVEHVWAIPWEVKEVLGHLDPLLIEKMSLKEIAGVITSIRHTPRYYKDAPRTIMGLTRLVVRRFGGDAAGIWRGRRASDVRDLFRSIHGVGEGIAAMSVVLIDKARLRDPFPPADRAEMDIKPDVHLRRVLYRIGAAGDQEVNTALRAARWLNPSCPGDLNEPLWNIGRTTCHAGTPDCHLCPIDQQCGHVGLQSRPHVGAESRYSGRQATNRGRLTFHRRPAPGRIDMEADGSDGSGGHPKDSAGPEHRFATLKWEVERESRLIYKVQKLFLAGLGKQETWETLLRIHPGFKRGTFNASWLALKKSNGRTPSLNEL